MSYNTKDELLEKSTQKLLSYLGTLMNYKTKIFMKVGEKPGDFKIRRDEFEASNAEYLKNLPTKLNSLSKEQRIQAILDLERKEGIGELPRNPNYKNLLETEKEVGNILVGVNADGKRKALNFVENTSEDRKDYINFLVGAQAQTTATATETATETTQTPAPETAIQQQAQSAVGADPNTIIDKPPRRGRPPKNILGKDIKDNLIILGLKDKLSKLEKIKPEDMTAGDLEDMNELQAALSYRMYKKTENVNPEKGEEYLSRVKRLVGKKGVMVNPTDPLIAQQATDAMKDQPPPRQIASVQAEPSQEEEKQEYDVKIAPAQPPQQQMPQSPKSPVKISSILGGKKPSAGAPTVADGNLTNANGDRSIGNVREIGIGVYDELAKQDEIIPPQSQRQKSLEQFANMRWIPKGGNNNSVLADLSPFQKIDDLEYNLRYGKTFKINAKIPVRDYYKPAMLKRCQSFFTQPQFTPNDKIITLMQPSTPIGFAHSNDNKTRNVLINEKEFNKKENMDFLPKYTDRPKKSNPFSACNGLESYYPNEMIMPPSKDPLQNSSIVIHPDTNQSYFL